MRTKIIKIGNSLGIIIPAKILKKLSMREKDDIVIELRGPRLIIESVATKETRLLLYQRQDGSRILAIPGLKLIDWEQE